MQLVKFGGDSVHPSNILGKNVCKAQDEQILFDEKVAVDVDNVRVNENLPLRNDSIDENEQN